jgi:hypothetical protein
MSSATLADADGPGVGVLPQACVGEAELRGVGVVALKSAALSFVSVHSFVRTAAEVLESADTEPLPSKSLALP